MRLTIATGIYPPSIGGPATYSKLLKETLPQHGIEVVIVSFDEVRHLPKVLRHIVYTFKLLHRSKNSEVIYAQDPVSVGFSAVLVSLVLRKRFLLKIVGDYAWEQATQRSQVTDLLDVFVTKHKEYPLLVRLFKKIETFVARKADTIIVPSDYLKRVVSAWGIDPQKIEVIYNAYTSVIVSETKETLRNELHIKGTTLISIGRLVPWKGFDMLIEVMKDISVKFPDIRLLIVGSGPYEKELNKCVRENKAERYVTMVGGVSKDTVMKYLKASDVFVLNTAYEGFSHQLLEAMTIGTPVVTTDVGGNPELITDKMHGLLVPYNSKEDMMNAIETMITNKTLAEQLANEAQKRVTTFSKEKMIMQLVEILSK